MFSFREADGVKVANLNPGTYTLAKIAAELQRAMNAAGSQEYTVVANRANRLVTVSSVDAFDLLSLTGPGEFVSAFPIFGFRTDIDLVGEISYTGEFGCGSEYAVQCPLQSYVPTSINQKAIDPVKKKTTTGIVEAVSYGKERLMECEMLFITNIPQPAGSIIRSNPQGVEEANAFLEYATTLAEVEFMEDENNPDEFEVLILDLTEFEQNGMGHKLREEYEEGLPNYYSSGKLTWSKRGAA